MLESIARGMPIPGHRRRRRQLPKGVNLKHTVEVCMFTDHLLYKEFCDVYSGCERGLVELDEYVRTVALGVSMCG